MVSLLKLAKVTEEGVRFLSPHDGTPMYMILLTIDCERAYKIWIGYLPQSTRCLCRTVSAPTS